LFGFIILNFSSIPSGTLLGTRVPKKNIFSSIENMLLLTTPAILPVDYKEGMTTYSSNIA